MPVRLSCWSIALLAVVLTGALRGQGCVAVPADTPAIGSPSSAPFGNNNPNDPIFSDLRYQVLVPRTMLGTQPLRIRDLQVAPAGSRVRQLQALTLTLGHNAAGQLANPMSANLGAPTVTRHVEQWLVPTIANTWSSLGVPLDFLFDPAIGDLVIEFRVIGGGALGGSGTAGMRTDQALPYQWTPGGGTTGSSFAGGGIKLRLCTDTHGLLELGGGCRGSNNLVPQLGYTGSAAVGGGGLQVTLADGRIAPASPVVLLWSFDVRPAPLDLAAIGASGCSTHLYGDVLDVVLTGNGTAAVPLAVPAAPFPCLPLWNQWLVFDPAANPFGLVTSNLGRILVGN